MHGFDQWNAKVLTKVLITRSEVMRESGIGSLKTYTKCMYELEEWGYLAYEPTFDSNAGTRVCMVRFDKADQEGQDDDRLGSRTIARAHTRLARGSSVVGATRTAGIGGPEAQT